MNEFALEAQRQAEELATAVRKMERTMTTSLIRDRDSGRLSPAYAGRMLDALESGESPLHWLDVDTVTRDEAWVALLVHRVVDARSEAEALLGKETAHAQ